MLTKEALVKFRGDETDYVRAIDLMFDADEKLHATRKRQAYEVEGFFANIEANYKSMTSVVDTATNVWGKAMGILEDYGKRLDREAAAAGVSIEGLARASGSLKTNTELLTHAAKLNQSVFKLTQEQMELTERAMYALEERGEDSTAVWNAFSSALTKGTVRSLEQFGIMVDTAGLKMDENGELLDKFGQRAEAVDAIFKAVNKTLGEDMASASHDAADSIQALTVRLHNSWDQVKFDLVNLATAFTPVLGKMTEALELSARFAAMGIGGVGQMMGVGGAGGGSGGISAVGDVAFTLANPLAYNKKAYDYVTDATGYELDLGNNVSGGLALARRMRAQAAAQAMGFDLSAPEVAAAVAAVSGRSFGRNGVDASDINSLFGLDPIRMQLDEFDAPKEGDFFGMFGIDPIRVEMNKLNARYAGTGTPLSLGHESASHAADIDYEELLRRQVAYLERSQALDDMTGQSMGIVGGDRYAALDQDVGAAMGRLNFDEINSREKRYAESAGRRNKSMLEGVFGKPDEFNAYKSLFDGLTNAVGGTYEAIITGSEPAGQAFKKLIAAGLMATGKGELVEGIKQEAWAIGELAFGNVAGFALHQKSAALHFAAAAAAGIAASALGAGGSSGAGGGTGAGAAMPSGSGVTGTQERGREIIYVVADPYGRGSSRNNQNEARRYLNSVNGGPAGKNS